MDLWADLIAGACWMVVGLFLLKPPLSSKDELLEKELKKIKNKRGLEIFFGIIFLVASVFFQVFCGMALSTRMNYQEFANEVKLEQVSVKGKNIFDFEGRITFNNGEIESVVLKKGTTKKEE